MELHAAAEYLVYFVGFSTCFPYLGGLPPNWPRRGLPAPRKHVPVGSVAIGGAQAGIYPLASPGGWRLIGRTDLQALRPRRSPPPLLRMGDRVRFVPVAGGAALNRIHVIAPGFLTTVQDLGRFGYAHFGISASGAADPLALRAGNLLVGNAENAAALEMTLTGGEFAFEGAAVIALTGSDFGVDRAACGSPWKSGRAKRCAAEPRATGRAAICAVRGGLDVPLVMGSASVHVMTGVGGRPLRRGDVAPDRRRGGAPAAQAGARHSRCTMAMACLRATAGPQARVVRRRAVRRELPGERGIQSHGNPAAGPGAALARRADDHRRRALGRRAGAARRPADHAVRGAPDHRRISQAGQRDLRRFLAARAVAAARRSPLRTCHHGRRAGAAARPGGVAVFAMKIDLNCDMGELEDAAHEAALMEYITSANIACGGHAGDAQTMERTARLALERGVRIGAHPGYPDRENFGRLEIAMTRGGDRGHGVRADRAAG